MSPCPSTHPEHGVPCEGEAEGHLGRHHSSWPYREWGEFVSAPVCGAAHSSGRTCGKDAHPEEERHSASVGYGWLVWGAGLPDLVHVKEDRREAMRREEDAQNAKYEQDRGREPWRPETGNTWRWL